MGDLLYGSFDFASKAKGIHMATGDFFLCALQKKDEFDILKILFSTLEHQNQAFWSITTLIFGY